MAQSVRTEPAPLAANVAWHRILLRGPAEEVLERVVEGDPLDLRRRIRHLVVEGCFLVDTERAFLRAAAACAHGAPAYGGFPELSAWIDERVREAVRDLARGTDEICGGRTDAAPPDVFDLLARPLGLGSAALRRTVRAFNACNDDRRRAFARLILEPSGPGRDGPSRRLATCLRLLWCDALALEAPRASGNLPRARAELEATRKRELRSMGRSTRAEGRARPSAATPPGSTEGLEAGLSDLGGPSFG